jgi:hypothetical protein
VLLKSRHFHDPLVGSWRRCVRCAPVLFPHGAGREPGGIGTDPRGRGLFRARERGGDGRSGRHLVILVRDLDETKPYTLALAATDLTSTSEATVA